MKNTKTSWLFAFYLPRRRRPGTGDIAAPPSVRPSVCLSPKGAKVYPASRRRSNKRVGLKGQLAPHCVPWLKNSIVAYKRLSTSLGSKTLNNTSSLGLGLVCWSLTSLCHSNGHIETMPAREINPFTALTRIRPQFLRTQWSTSNHQRVDTTTPQTAEPSGLAPWVWGEPKSKTQL